MDPFAKHGTKVTSKDGGTFTEGRFVGIGDGPKQVLSVEGILLGREDSSKYPGNHLYVMGTTEEIVKVGGNKFLDDKVTEIGALYKIVYVGKAVGKAGRAYKTFDVFTVDAATARAEGHDKLYKSTVNGATAPDGEEDDSDLPF